MHIVIIGCRLKEITIMVRPWDYTIVTIIRSHLSKAYLGFFGKSEFIESRIVIFYRGCETFKSLARADEIVSMIAGITKRLVAPDE